MPESRPARKPLYLRCPLRDLPGFLELRRKGELGSSGWLRSIARAPMVFPLMSFTDPLPVLGAGVGDGIASMYHDFGRNGGNGHFLMALDIGRFMDHDSYFERFEALVAMPRASGGHVLLPGEIRWEHWRDAMQKRVEVDAGKLRELASG